MTQPSTAHIYTLSLHDALPISSQMMAPSGKSAPKVVPMASAVMAPPLGTAGGLSTRPFVARRAGTPIVSESAARAPTKSSRSEEHTSELQSLRHLVCRLLLEKK